MDNTKASQITLTVLGVLFLAFALFSAATKGISLKPILNVASGILFLTAAYILKKKEKSTEKSK